MEEIKRSRAGHLAETGATTAEYAVTCGVGVGFAGVLYRFLTSSTGQKIVGDVFDKVMSILPF